MSVECGVWSVELMPIVGIVYFPNSHRQPSQSPDLQIFHRTLRARKNIVFLHSEWKN